MNYSHFVLYVVGVILFSSFIIAQDEELVETPGLGTLLSSGPGVGDSSYQSHSSWLDGTDSGLDSKWNAALIKQRKNEEKAKENGENEKKIEEIKSALRAIRLRKSEISQRIPEIESTIGEKEANFVVAEQEEKDTPCPHKETSGPIQESSMQSEALPDLTVGLTVPVPSRKISEQNSVKMELVMDELSETNAIIPTNVNKSSVNLIFHGEPKDLETEMKLASLYQESKEWETEASQRAVRILRSDPQIFTTPPVIKDLSSSEIPSVELSSRSTWAFMNRVENNQVSVVTPKVSRISISPKKEEISAAKFNSYPTPPIPEKDLKLVIESPKFDSSPTTTGCCVLEKIIWDPETLKPLAEYSYTDGVEEKDCPNTKGETHFAGEMCFDVQAAINKEQNNDNVMIDPVVNVVQQRNKMRSIVPESNSLWTKISASDSGSELSHDSLRQQDHNLVMPEGDHHEEETFPV